jgi:glucose-specific phosphotransferase system IIA component
MKLTAKIKQILPIGDKGKQEQLVAPLSGRVIPLDQVPDETFATRILGDGIAILPLEGTLRSPADARIDQAFDTAHAITLVTDGGAELLLHVGIDTVELQGRHFELLVGAGDRVQTGDALIRFDRQAIATADYNLTTPMIVSNSERYELTPLASGDVRVGAPLLMLKRKEDKR